MKSDLHIQWHEVMIDGYPVMSCLALFAYLVWRLIL